MRSGSREDSFKVPVPSYEGTYKAAITRKVQEKKTVVTKDFSCTYEFFGEGEKTANVLTSPTQETVVESVRIEAFMLDVEREVADNPYDFLDKRFDEIEEAKKKTTAINPPVIKVSENNHSPWIPNKTSVVNSASNVFDNDFDEDYSFRDWQLKQQEKKEPTLFSDSEMNKMIDISSWEPDPTIIHKLVCQMVTCSLIVGENIDLKQWIVKWMDKKYKEIFGFDSTKSSQFQEWKDFIVEFMVNQYSLVDNTIPTGIIDNWDLIQSKVASAMYTELYQYAPDDTNPYIDDYKEILMRYIYE